MDPNHVGVQMAKLCVKANLPTLYVARKLGVSRYTVHSWFRGQEIRDKNKIKVEAFIKELNRGFDENIFPMITLSLAQQYLDSIQI
jgi:hypothetical protein